MTTNHRLLCKIGVAEFNDGVRILTGSAQIAVSAHVQWKYGKQVAQSVVMLPELNLLVNKHKSSIEILK